MKKIRSSETMLRSFDAQQPLRGEPIRCAEFFTFVYKTRNWLRRKFAERYPNIIFDLAAYDFARPAQKFIEITLWEYIHNEQRKFVTCTHRGRVRFFPGTMDRKAVRREIRQHLSYRKKMQAFEAKMKKEARQRSGDVYGKLKRRRRRHRHG